MICPYEFLDPPERLRTALESIRKIRSVEKSLYVDDLLGTCILCLNMVILDLEEILDRFYHELNKEPCLRDFRSSIESDISEKVSRRVTA